MMYSEFRRKYLKPFFGVDHVWSDDGYIVWRLGTGGNVELLHIRSFKKHIGAGTELIRTMLRRLKQNPPYFSVYGFSVATNEEAVSFYRRLGFHVEIVTGPYLEGKAALFSQSYDMLCQKLLTRNI